MDNEDKKALHEDHRRLAELVEDKKRSIQGRNMLLEARKSGVIAPLMTEIARKKRELGNLYDEVKYDDSHEIYSIQDQRKLLTGLVEWVNGNDIEQLNKEIADIEADMVLIDAQLKVVDDKEEDGLIPTVYKDELEKENG